jgi:hypothetical protein
MTMILAPVVAKAPAKPKQPRAPRAQADQQPAPEQEETQMAAALKAAGATAE